MTETLPQELVDHIIDNLAAQWRLAEPDYKSRETLGVCMLVSRSFLTSVRRQLFRRLRLREKARYLYDDDVFTDGMTGFLELLNRDPLSATSSPLAAQMRAIKLEMHGIPPPQKHSSKSEKSTARKIQKWNDKREHLYHILKATSNLDTFALEFVLTMDAHSIHIGIFIAIEKVCKSPNITRLQFANIYHFPVDLLAMCTNLRELCLGSVSIAKPESLGSSTRAESKPASTTLRATWNKDSLRCLETLDTRLSADVIVAINQAALPTSHPFSHLKTLQLGLPMGSESEPNSLEQWEVVKSAAPSLECLCIRGIDGDTLAGKANQPFLLNIFLSELTSLRTLKLRTTVPGCSQFQDLPRDLLPHLSPETRTPTAIETIWFDFYFPDVLDVDDFQEHPERVARGPGIDSVLTGGLYPRLRTVKVRYLFEPQGYWRWLVRHAPATLTRLDEVVNEVFSRVLASHKIKFEISSEAFKQHDHEYESQW